MWGRLRLARTAAGAAGGCTGLAQAWRGCSQLRGSTAGAAAVFLRHLLQLPTLQAAPASRPPS